MKTDRYGNGFLREAMAAIVFAMAVICRTTAADATSATNALPPIPKSVFIIPTNVKEGRDPFYPNSSRTAGTAPVQAGTNTKAEVSILVLSGLNLKPGNRMAIINRRSIAEGETAEVEVPEGTLKVRCVEITRSNTVIVEVGNQRRELRMRVE